jgi:hypothetical protein
MTIDENINNPTSILVPCANRPSPKPKLRTWRRSRVNFLIVRFIILAMKKIAKTIDAGLVFRKALVNSSAG